MLPSESRDHRDLKELEKRGSDVILCAVQSCRGGRGAVTVPPGAAPEI
jgi:hypothetical protein